MGEMAYGGSVHVPDPVCFRYFVGFIILSATVGQVGASIHEYKNEAFIPRFNSFFFHGGSEGLYASRVHDNNTTSEDKAFNGKSSISLISGLSLLLSEEQRGNREAERDATEDWVD